MPLIGREREVADVLERLARRRLVTLTGPAGIGKTAVAMAVAERAKGSFELGAHLVDLTRVDTPDAVGGAIAGQLGFASFEALLSSPSDQPALVVVDNCEHVIAAAAEAVAALLAACNSPTVLATSRSPLDLPDESLVLLGPLALPPPGAADTDYDAVRLFLERAHDAGAALDETQFEAVAELCRQLDGVALALELAAARTRTMQPAEILAALAEGVEVLSRPRFRGAERHRSLTDTIEWSYRLLPPEAAAMFERLGLSSGPFTAELARAVGADLGLDPAAAADTLQLLVDSSLVVTEPKASVTSFRLLETVRAFALRRLEAPGASDEARRRMADHIVAEAVAVIREGTRRWDASVFARLQSLYDNIVAALRACLTADDDGARCRVLCAVLWGVVHQGHTDEIAALSEETIKRWPDTKKPFAAEAVATAATARLLTGDAAGALALVEATIAEGEVSPVAAVTLRRAMGYSLRALGDSERALECFRDISARARENGLLSLALEADVTCAQLLDDHGDLDGALALARRAAAEAAQHGSAVNEVWARTVAANFELRRDLERGLAEVREALAEARRIAYPVAISVNLRSLAWGLTRAGDHAGAADCLGELFDGLFARAGVADVRGALVTTAELLHAVGDASWATLAATARQLPVIGLTGAAFDATSPLPPTDAAPVARRDAIAMARARLRALRAAPPAPPAPAASIAPDPDARLVDHGEFWEITFAGRTIHAKASKGMADLARLLTAPGREVHCLELMGASLEESSTGEVIDDVARRGYEARIRELQDEIDEAERHHDLLRAERAQAELDVLVEHLSSALGLGGRTRQRGSTVERARSAVTQRIRSTIRRLAKDHPELGRHLDVSVTTGTYCVYRPERPISWRR